MSILFGVGVGPGDPELMTLKAIRIISECPVIAVPDEEAENSVAYRIALGAGVDFVGKEILGVPMPMIKDKEKLQEVHRKSAELLVTRLKEGKSIAFLTLGDPTVYSTFTYLQELVREQGFETQIVSGIASFLSAAARQKQSLVIRDEMLHVIPSTYGVKEAMDLKGTKVFMKVGNKLADLKKELEGRKNPVCFIENCGMENERVITEISKLPDRAGYYSLLIVYERIIPSESKGA